MSVAEFLWFLLVSSVVLNAYRHICITTQSRRIRLLLIGAPLLGYAVVLTLPFWMTSRFDFWFALVVLIAARIIFRQILREVSRELLLRSLLSAPKGWAVVPRQQVLVRTFWLLQLVDPRFETTKRIPYIQIYESGQLYELEANLLDMQDRWLEPDRHTEVTTTLLGLPPAPRRMTVTNKGGAAKVRRVRS